MATRPKKPTLKAAPAPGQSFVKITVNLPPDVADLVRNAAYWEQVSVAAIVAAGIKAEVKRLEKRRGKAFLKRRGPVKPGRPFQT